MYSFPNFVNQLENQLHNQLFCEEEGKIQILVLF